MNANTTDTAQVRAEFFGLRFLPFSSKRQSDIFLTEGRSATLNFLTARRGTAGVALLSGDAGVGKTTLLRAHLKAHQEDGATVVITLPSDGAVNLLRETCKRFCSAVPESCDAEEFAQDLARELGLESTRSATPLLIVDQVERLTEDSLPSLCEIAERAANGRIPLSLVLVGSPVHSATAVNLEETPIRPLIRARYVLAPFDAEESAQYIIARFSASGGDASRIIEPAAIDAIHRLAGGNAGEINRLVNLSMRLAHRAGDRVVRLSHVEAAAVRGTRVGKSARRDQIILNRGRSTKGIPGGPGSTVSLADVNSDGCAADFIGESTRGPNEGSTPLHAGTVSAASVASTRVDRRPGYEWRLANDHGAASFEERFCEIGSALHEATQRAAVLDARAHHHAALLDALDEKIHCAEDATARSSEAELRLRTLAANVAVHAEALQERMAALLEMADFAYEADNSLRELGAEANKAATLASQTLSDAVANSQRFVVQSAQQATDFISQKSTDLHAQLQQAAQHVTSRIAEKSAGLQSQVDQVTLLIEERAPKFILATEHQLQDSVRQVVTALNPVKAEVQGLLAESAAAVETARAEIDREHQRSQRRLEQMLAQTADKLIAVSAACEQAVVSRTELDKGREAADASIARALEVAAELDRQRNDTRTAVAELNRTTASARHVGDTLSSLAAAADGKAQQLVSHESAARSLLNQLTDATVAAVDAAKVLADLQSAAETGAHRASERHAELSDAIGKLNASAAVERERLENQVSTSAFAAADLQGVVTVAMDARAQMHAALEEGMRQLARLEDLSCGADVAAQRSADLQTGLIAADVFSQKLADAITQSQRSVAELQAVTETARSQEVSLADLYSKDEGIKEQHHQLVSDAEALLGRVVMRLDSLRDTDAQLEQWHEATHALQSRLADLDERLAEAFDAVGEPRRILADAQAYAAQLVKVCDAVKKVKTGVSQAALAADERASELTSAEQQAAARLHHLRQDLAAAAATLAQWVKEADRAQARLESTLQACPSIDQTHAPQALKNLAQSASDLGPGVVPGGKPVSTGARREEEIAQLLAEARKARKEVEGDSKSRTATLPTPPEAQPLRSSR